MSPALDGHEMLAQLIVKHGGDRYPTFGDSLLKLLSELGELADAILSGNRAAAEKEYGDVGYCVYSLGDRMPGGPVNLPQQMRRILDLDQRTLAEGTLRADGAFAAEGELDPEVTR